MHKRESRVLKESYGICWKKRMRSGGKDHMPSKLFLLYKISIVGCVYKILGKGLAVKMKEPMHLIMGQMQEAFLSDRQIRDLNAWKEVKKGFFSK